MAVVLERLPQKPPFLFIDKIMELSEGHIVTERKFREDEYFYKGHFPGDPVTPGVILVETMAQAGLVALGIYLLGKEQPGVMMRTLFSECAVEFFQIVRPGEVVTVRGEKIFWRRNKLKSQVELRKENGEMAASGVVSGVGVLV
ncbi:MAG: beta-hydroxyacyl-ACP dehydratase [Proteobacteria bacterium]|nr:MAG: beta-hydroxyacyl-ACP dehydratase [Pseudomonadota bacterium]